MFRVLTDPDFAALLLAPGAERADLATRWARLERSLHASTNALRVRSGARMPWPASLGTPPWGLRAALDELGVGRRFTVLRVDGRSPSQVEAALDRVAAALAQGVPVPLYVGNATLPRHVVLATEAGPGWVQVYDPASGQPRRLRRDAVVRASAGVSGWDQLWAAVVPRV